MDIWAPNWLWQVARQAFDSTRTAFDETSLQRRDQLGITPDELRLLIRESSRFMKHKYHSIPLNLFELPRITVDDVMIPRHQIEPIDLATDPETRQTSPHTRLHTRLPVHTGRADTIIGILHARKVLSMHANEINGDNLCEVMPPPNFIPSGTPLFTQLQNFQENHRRQGLVVDEYGELQGLVTLEDILEQIIGKFATSRSLQLARRWQHIA